MLLSPQLHLANEKHHYATSTETPLRAKMWEQEGSERKGREEGGWRMEDGGRGETTLSQKALLFPSAQGQRRETNYCWHTRAITKHACTGGGSHFTDFKGFKLMFAFKNCDVASATTLK